MNSKEFINEKCRDCPAQCLDKAIKDLAGTFTRLNMPRDWETPPTLPIQIQMPIKSAAFLKHAIETSPLPEEDTVAIFEILLQEIFMAGIEYLTAPEKGAVKGGLRITVLGLKKGEN